MQKGIGGRPAIVVNNKKLYLYIYEEYDIYQSLSSSKTNSRFNSNGLKIISFLK